MIRTIVALAMAAWAGALQAAPQNTTPKTAPIPMVSGPVTGPGTMFPGLREMPKGTELPDFDYVAKEYFVSGTANGKPYTTRIVVHEPRDLKKFSGIVVSEIMHSSGNSWMF